MIYEKLMGNGGVVCKLIGSGDCKNCKARDFKLSIIPLNEDTKRIYRIIKRC
jgi:hypothetical protein